MIYGIYTRYYNWTNPHSAKFIRNQFRKEFPNCTISFTWFPNCKNWKSVSICVKEKGVNHAR